MQEDVKCKVCGKLNSLRNYYCYYCGALLKDKKGVPQKTKERCKYILRLDMIDANSEEKATSFTPYHSKELKKNDASIVKE